jgi:hypothetical protein
MSGGTQRKRIGEFMMEKGLIHRDWINPILEHSKANGTRFGESAVALGYVTEKDLRQVLLQPFGNQKVFHLNPNFIPSVTADLIPLDAMVRLGIIPLGFKNEFHWFKTRQRLNLGVLSSDRREVVDWAGSHLGTVKSFKTFQVLPDEFLQTLELCYGIDRSSLLDLGPEQIDVNLALYLQLERRKGPRAAK